jgi:hypothetical protein
LVATAGLAPFGVLNSKTPEINTLIRRQHHDGGSEITHGENYSRPSGVAGWSVYIESPENLHKKSPSAAPSVSIAVAINQRQCHCRRPFFSESKNSVTHVSTSLPIPLAGSHHFYH